MPLLCSGLPGGTASILNALRCPFYESPDCFACAVAVVVRLC